MFSSDKFVSGIVAVVVAVIVVGLVALPIITQVTTGMEDTTLKTIIGIIPIFLVIGILMAVVGMFLKSRND